MRRITLGVLLIISFFINSVIALENKITVNDEPGGKIIKGIRVITISKAFEKLDIFVYRGETVTLILEPRDFKHSIHIPAFNVSQEIAADQEAKVTFEVKETGVFPIYCNGDCPAGNGSQAGKIVVMKFEADKNAAFTTITAKQAQEMLKNKDTLLLDVRTPVEYYEGHIKGTTFIPLYQLQDRIDEIAVYKNKDIIIYCRSGNRSVVAAEILIHNGFKRIYHIGGGIKEWVREGFSLTK